MRSVKDSPYPFQCDSYPRSLPFAYLGSERKQQRLNVRPYNIRQYWLLEYGLQRFPVFVHAKIVSFYDTIVKEFLAILSDSLLSLFQTHKGALPIPDVIGDVVETVLSFYRVLSGRNRRGETSQNVLTIFHYYE